jgi:hypothetical protein
VDEEKGVDRERVGRKAFPLMRKTFDIKISHGDNLKSHAINISSPEFNVWPLRGFFSQLYLAKAP